MRAQSVMWWYDTRQRALIARILEKIPRRGKSRGQEDVVAERREATVSHHPLPIVSR